MVRRCVAALLLLTSTFAALRSRAADVPVPVQLALFTKVWKLDRNFSATTVRIGIVYQESNAESLAVKDAVVAWIASRTDMRAVPVALDRPNGLAALESAEVDVFYVTRLRSADPRDVAKVARARNIRTMTGTADYVRRGLSVAIGVRNDRPLITINLEAARAEGAAYQAQLLQLSEIVRE